jgi:hypothetical protein
MGAVQFRDKTDLIQQEITGKRWKQEIYASTGCHHQIYKSNIKNEHPEQWEITTCLAMQGEHKIKNQLLKNKFEKLKIKLQYYNA